MFRAVTLPEELSGELYLHSMLGRYEEFDEALEALAEFNINRVFALVADEELRSKAPEYARSVAAGDFPVPRTVFPIPDFDVPTDPRAFLSLAADVVDMLRKGQCLLVHCAGGIGRSGLLAVTVLMRLGYSREEALLTVRSAQAGPETPEQEEFLEWVELALAGEEHADSA